MMNLVRRFGFRSLILTVSVALAGMLFPAWALASKQIIIDWRGRDGDPIDGNDFSSGGSGGGGDDIFHQDYIGFSSSGSADVGLWVLPLGLDGTRIMIVPRMESGVFMVRFVMLPRTDAQAEAGHAE